MSWGFPKWDGKGVIINAKSETASEKNIKQSLLQRRCVIPSTGFYEWNNAGKSKEKYLFRSETSPVLYMAGILILSRTDKSTLLYSPEMQTAILLTFMTECL